MQILSLQIRAVNGINELRKKYQISEGTQDVMIELKRLWMSGCEF